MEGEIVNRVSKSPLVTIDLEDFYPKGERISLDIAPWLWQGMVLKEKDFRSMRSWAAANSDIDSSIVFRRIYDMLYDFVQPQSIPAIILILADYQHKACFVADKEINTVACLTEIMASGQWK